MKWLGCLACALTACCIEGFAPLPAQTPSAGKSFMNVCLADERIHIFQASNSLMLVAIASLSFSSRHAQFLLSTSNSIRSPCNDMRLQLFFLFVQCATSVRRMSQYDAGVEFAGGLIGSDVELPAFDPLKVSNLCDSLRFSIHRALQLVLLLVSAYY
jgi:hypothetical protein